MCEVCAVFGIGGHWTDAGQRADPRLPAPAIAHYRIERRRRITLINYLLAKAELEVTDWDGEAYWIEHRRGHGERVSDLNALWAAAERLAGRPFDPLAATFP